MNQATQAERRKPKKPAEPVTKITSQVANTTSQPKVAKDIATQVNNLSVSNTLNDEVQLCQKFHELLKINLDCPVCYDHLCAPISQCPNGHLICEDCKSKIQNSSGPGRCPTCRETLGDIRSLVAEGMAANLQYPCKWKTWGCLEELGSPDRKIHERKCKFRPFDCNLCSWVGCEDDIVPHMRRAHHFTVLPDGEQIANSENFGTYFRFTSLQPSGCGHYTTVDAVKLLVYAKIDEDVLMIAIRHAGTGRPGRFKISVKCKDENIIEWSSNVLSIREEVNEFDDGLCFRIPLRALPVYSLVESGYEFLVPAVLEICLNEWSSSTQ